MANNLVSKVEISVACKHLMDTDIFSKSDPMVVLFMKHGSNKFIEMGRTETIQNNLNPEFSKSFSLEYYFEEIQRLKFQVYDIDSNSTILNQHDFLGEFECNLGELVSRANIEGKLTGKVSKGTIILRCSELGSCKEVFYMKFLGHNLDKKDFFGKSDPFLELMKCAEPIPFTGEPVSDRTKFTLAHRTEYISKTLNPDWKTFQVRNNKLCQGERDRLVRLDVYDWNRSGSDNPNDTSSSDFIGSCYTSVNDMEQNQGKHSFFKLINNKKLKKKNYTNSGTLTLTLFRTETEYTFVDYISGGTQLHFTVSIDFTASNGVQTNSRSLHYVHQNPGQMNQYELAICSVGSIIQDYDYDKMFPALGFGSKIPPSQTVSHCFPITFRNDNPFCYRVEGLLNAYRNAVRMVTLFGPTNFAPSIRHVQKFAQLQEDGSQYYVLLIITDGIITDIENTVSAIVDCSYLPMSIIIIGVGGEDFSAMDMLDCDNGLLRSGNKIAERDIVQFVPLRDYIQNQGDTLSNQASLARAVLAELPDQVALWMRMHRIKPKPASERPITLGKSVAGDISQQYGGSSAPTQEPQQYPGSSSPQGPYQPPSQQYLCSSPPQGPYQPPPQQYPGSSPPQGPYQPPSQQYPGNNPYAPPPQQYPINNKPYQQTPEDQFRGYHQQQQQSPNQFSDQLSYQNAATAPQSNPPYYRASVPNISPYPNHQHRLSHDNYSDIPPPYKQ